MSNQNHCCGTCCWHEYCSSEWLCTNEYSENNGLETEYSDSCPDWERK